MLGLLGGYKLLIRSVLHGFNALSLLPLRLYCDWTLDTNFSQAAVLRSLFSWRALPRQTAAAITNLASQGDRCPVKWTVPWGKGCWSRDLSRHRQTGLQVASGWNFSLIASLSKLKTAMDSYTLSRRQNYSHCTVHIKVSKNDWSTEQPYLLIA